MSPPLIDLFIDAVRVDAVSLREEPMARFVRGALADLPVRIVEEKICHQFGGECNNLICLPPSFDRARPALALFSHLDTPRPTIGVNPIISEDRITGDGTTILGVDNRAGVSALLHALREHVRGGGQGNFIVVFTVGEELGLFGSKYFEPSPYPISMGFVFDCSKRPGTFIRSAVGCSLYTTTFRGLASHAGVAPEKGVNAIQIAGRALARMPMGRLHPTMTSNVGKIRGGEATNVVPEICTMEGEVRSFSPLEISRHLEELRGIFQQTAEEGNGSMEMTVHEDFPPYVLAEDSPVYRETVALLQSVGLDPHPIDYLGGSDANMLNGKGLPAVNLGIGAQNPHGNDEFILLEDLQMASRMAGELMKRSAQS